MTPGERHVTLALPGDGEAILRRETSRLCRARVRSQICLGIGSLRVRLLGSSKCLRVQGPATATDVPVGLASIAARSVVGT